MEKLEAVEAAHVLERLLRIQLLDRAQAPPSRLLAELRELVAEAEASRATSGRARPPLSSPRRLTVEPET